MPRSRKTPKKKAGVVAVNLEKLKPRTPRKRVTKAAANLLKPSPPKLESERCRDWLMAHSSTTGLEYDMIDDHLDDSMSEEGDIKPPAIPESEPNVSSCKTKTKINLVCEWMRCNRVLPSFETLRKHVLDSHLTDPCPVQTDGLIECCWDLCHFKTDDEPEFRRHFLHHLFHSNLKSIGEGLLLRKTVPPCVVDSRRRNTIADCPGDWSCSWEDCGRVYEQMFDFIEHLKTHVKFLAALRCRHDPKEDRMLRCGWQGCDKEYPKSGRLVEHLRSHSSERLMACPNCGSTFTSYTKFYSHFNRQGEDKKYQCVHCFKYFFNEELLTNHMYIHVNCYKCTMCDMTCPSPSGLATHMRHRHIAEKPFRCDLCDYGCIKKRDLERHVLAKHENNVYECDEFNCNFSTESLFMMRKHDREVHLGLIPNVYGCHCCPKRYGRGYILSQHLIKKHQFQLPSGHSRFTFSPDLEGIFRLQTMRMESLEVTQAIMSPSRSSATHQPADCDSKSHNFKLSDIEPSQHKLGSLHINVSTSDAKPESATDDQTPLVSDGFSSLPDLRCSADETANDDCYEERCARHVGDDHRTAAPSLRKTALRRRAAQQQAAQTSPFKSIQDFSMVQRYLCQDHVTNKKIKIEVTTLDEDGEVIQSNTVKADEFYIEPDTILGL